MPQPQADNAAEQPRIAQAEAQQYQGPIGGHYQYPVGGDFELPEPQFVPRAPELVRYDDATERRKLDEYERRKLDLGDGGLADIRLDLLRLAHKAVATMPNKDQVDIKQLAKEFEEFVLRGRKS